MTSIPITITHRALYIPHSGYARCRNTEIAQKDAEQGSAKLKFRIEAMFDNWAARHRITFGEAKVANLYPGVKL